MAVDRPGQPAKRNC